MLTDDSVRRLFDLAPGLCRRLPVYEAAALPTPVEPLSGLGENAFIKRDDISHPDYGGNKIRKLEFILGEALQAGKQQVITFGAIGTNHGVATSLLCRDAGLRCTVLLFDQPMTDTVRRNACLMAHYGAQLEYCGSLLSTVRRFYLHPRRLRSSNYFLFAGGSNVAGTLGFVNAALELKQQIELGQCPQPKRIVVALGSSATLAGLTLGMAVAGLDIEVIGVRVAPSHLGPLPICTTATVSRLMQRTAARLTALGCKMPLLPQPIVDDRWFGSGYGVATEAGLNAQSVLSQHGVSVEQTYTAKAAAAFLAVLAETEGPALFWNTFNSRPPPEDLCMDLPAAIRLRGD